MNKYNYKVGDRVVCVSDNAAWYINKPKIGKVYKIDHISNNGWAIMDGSENYHLDDFVPYKKVLINELLKDE